MHIDYPQSAITLNAVYLMRKGERSEGRRIRTTEVSFPNGTGDGTVQTMDIRLEMSLTISDFMFYKDTIASVYKGILHKTIKYGLPTY